MAQPGWTPTYVAQGLTEFNRRRRALLVFGRLVLLGVLLWAGVALVTHRTEAGVSMLATAGTMVAGGW